MRTWTIKFTTGFCSTSHRMAQMKKHTTSVCPHCSHLDDDTSHILQYPNPEAQTLWDGAILQLREHLKENDTDPGIIEDISAGIDAWWRQVEPPLAITQVGQAQAVLTWQNFTHGFISTTWKIQQATYYNNCRNMVSATTWATNLLHLLLKKFHQQWDHRNKVIHQLQPDQVKDLTLDIEIWLQYNQGHDSLPVASRTLLSKPLPDTLTLPHNEKNQWLLSIKAAHQRQQAAAVRIATAQRRLMEQLFWTVNQPTQHQ